MSQVSLAITLINIHQFFYNLWHMSSADIQKSANGITFSTTSLLLTLCCSEAALLCKYIQLLNVYKIFTLPILLCAYTTLQTTSRETRKVQRVFFGWLWVALKRTCFVIGWLCWEPVVYSRCSKWSPLPSLMHAVVLLIDGLVDDAQRNAAVTL